MPNTRATLRAHTPLFSGGLPRLRLYEHPNCHRLPRWLRPLPTSNTSKYLLFSARGSRRPPPLRVPLWLWFALRLRLRLRSGSKAVGDDGATGAAIEHDAENDFCTLIPDFATNRLQMRLNQSGPQVLRCLVVGRALDTWIHAWIFGRQLD